MPPYSIYIERPGHLREIEVAIREFDCDLEAVLEGIQSVSLKLSCQVGQGK